MPSAGAFGVTLFGSVPCRGEGYRAPLLRRLFSPHNVPTSLSTHAASRCSIASCDVGAQSAILRYAENLAATTVCIIKS